MEKLPTSEAVTGRAGVQSPGALSQGLGHRHTEYHPCAHLTPVHACRRRQGPGLGCVRSVSVGWCGSRSPQGGGLLWACVHPTAQARAVQRGAGHRRSPVRCWHGPGARIFTCIIAVKAGSVLVLLSRGGNRHREAKTFPWGHTASDGWSPETASFAPSPERDSRVTSAWAFLSQGRPQGGGFPSRGAWAVWGEGSGRWSQRPLPRPPGGRV